MPDVQGSADLREIPIQRVGVRSVRYPLTVCLSKTAPPQSTVGLFNLDVALPADRKGTHMSRFITLLEEQKAPLDLPAWRHMLEQMLVKLEARAGHMEVTFPYFISKKAPVSGVQSLLDYDVTLSGAMRDGMHHIALQVKVPVTSLCPCSKEISRYGAHNQRSHITIRVEPRPGADMTIESLVRVAEREASCELWALLKRPDERYVTEHAYEHPKFVEDLVRDMAACLDEDDRITAYVIEAENFESIHNHSAYARIESPVLS